MYLVLVLQLNLQLFLILKCEIIIIFAWNFSESIIKKLRKIYKGKNIKVVVPFPKLKVINL